MTEEKLLKRELKPYDRRGKRRRIEFTHKTKSTFCTEMFLYFSITDQKTQVIVTPLIYYC